MKEIIINNLKIELERKRIKNMYLRILPPEGRIHVSAPVRMSEEDIRRFVQTKQEWIIEQQQKIQRRHVNEVLEYVTGDILNVWGHPYLLEVVPNQRKNTVYLNYDRLILQTKETATKEQREHFINAWYKENLKQSIPGLMDKWEKIIGVKANDWTIRDMKTRWGTCNVRSKKITLNLQLAKKSPQCLEYVTVHELVHLLERSHNHIFKGYLDHFLPEWRKIKKEMNGVE